MKSIGRCLAALLLAMPALWADSGSILSTEAAEWKYLDGDNPPPTDWFAPEFDDQLWKSGQAPLGYGEDGLRTSIDGGADPSKRPRAAFFRTTFAVGKVSQELHYGLQLHVDDGAIVYLNGKRIDRLRIRPRPNQSEGKPYLGIKPPGNDPDLSRPVFVPLKRRHLSDDGNVLAIAVHQADASSSDLYLSASIGAWTLEEFGKLKRQRLVFDFEHDIRRLETAYTEKVNAFYARYRQATDEERKTLRSQSPRPDEEASQMSRLIELYPQEEPTIDALLWILSQTHRLSPAHLDILRQHHLDSARMATFCLRGSALPKALLQELLEKSPHPKVMGAAAFALASRQRSQTDLKEREEASITLKNALPWLGDLTLYDQPVTELAESLLFELSRLGLGQEAPDIEGEDLHGKRFRLTDYRGQVVVLDFWGHW